MTGIFVLALALLAEGGGTRPLDRVQMKSGETVEGYVVIDKPDALVVLVKSKERRIPVGEIASVRTAARSLNDVLDRHEKLPANDAAAEVELALYCREQALPGEAEVLALSALCADPANLAAHTLLGHVQREAGWMAKRGDKLVLFDKLVPARADLRDPWKLETSHYSILTNLSLRDATARAVDLERYYREFYRVLGAAVELREVYTPLGVGVYGDNRTFPESQFGRAAYFDRGTAQVVVNAAAVEPRRALVHEATHQLLHATTAGTRAGTGTIPGWLDEGLAEYFACSLLSDPGPARFELGAIAESHFKLQRETKKPHGLSRVLQFESGDFISSSDMDLKYAEAYTLVHFLMHGGGGKYRPKFFAFLQSAYAGKASAGDFKKSFDVPLRDVEEAWLAHVKLPTR